MNIMTLRTPVIKAGEMTLPELLDTALLQFEERSILIVTSKIVSLCESNVVSPDDINKEALIKQQVDYYVDPEFNPHHYHFSIVDGKLTSSGGIDRSNGDGNFVLWPRDVRQTANTIRQYLVDRFKITYAGVVIVDSTSLPLRRGAVGTSLAHSGFLALKDYRGTPDLFGRSMKVEVANICEGLAAGAVAMMGEGNEGTPLAVVTDIPFISFQDRDPSDTELNELHTSLEDDYYSTFLSSVPWLRGDRI